MPGKVAVGYAVIRREREKQKIIDLLRRAAASQGYDLVAVFLDKSKPGRAFRTVRELLDKRTADAVFTPRRADVEGLDTRGFYFVDYLIRYGYM